MFFYHSDINDQSKKITVYSETTLNIILYKSLENISVSVIKHRPFLLCFKITITIAKSHR